MKRLKCGLLGLAMGIFSCGAPVFADGELLSGKVSVDYGTNEILISCLSEADYIQAVTAVLYDYSLSEPQLADYLRLDEQICDDDGTAELSFKFGNDIASKQYWVELNGSGGQSADSNLKIPVWILNPDDAETAVKNINKAGNLTIESELEKVYDELELSYKEESDAYKSQFLSMLLNMRAEDYGSEFNNLTDIKNACAAASVLISLQKSEDAAEVINDNAALLKTDTENPEYKKFTSEAARLLQLKIPDVSSITGLQSVFEECVALAAINKCELKDMDGYLRKYSDVLTITDKLPVYSKFDKLKIARLLSGKGFTDIESGFKPAFLAAIGSPDNSGINTPSGGSPSRPSGGTSSTVSTDTAPKQEEIKKDSFTDSGEFAWAKESIEALSEMNIISGYGDGTFRGGNPVTREEFIKLIAAAFDIETDGAESDFSDVDKNDWAYPYISGAFRQQFILGREDNTFGYGERISRQDMAVIIDRAARLSGVKYPSDMGAYEFTDDSEIDDYAKESVYTLSGAGIINGTGSGGFSPKDSLTRAEAAKVIYGVLKIK